MQFSVLLCLFSVMVSVYAMDVPPNIPTEPMDILPGQPRRFLEREILRRDDKLTFSQVRNQFGGRGFWINRSQAELLRDLYRQEFKGEMRDEEFLMALASNFNFDDASILNQPNNHMSKNMIFKLARPEMFQMLVEHVIPRLRESGMLTPYSCEFINGHHDGFIRHLFTIGVFPTHEDHLRKLIRASDHFGLAKILKKNKLAVKKSKDGFNLSNPGVFYDAENFADDNTLTVLAKYGLHVQSKPLIKTTKVQGRRYAKFEDYSKYIEQLNQWGRLKDSKSTWLDCPVLDKVLQAYFVNLPSCGGMTIFELHSALIKQIVRMGVCFDDPAIFQKHGEYIRNCDTVVLESREEHPAAYALIKHMHQNQSISNDKANNFVRNNFKDLLETGDFDQDDTAFLYTLRMGETLARKMLGRGYDMNRSSLVPLIMRLGSPCIIQALVRLRYDFKNIPGFRRLLVERVGKEMAEQILFRMNFIQLLLGSTDSGSVLAGIPREILFGHILAHHPSKPALN